MQTSHLRVDNFGPITSVDINLGDLTIFTGSNGSGKGLLLQLIKLLIDKVRISVKVAYPFRIKLAA